MTGYDPFRGTSASAPFRLDEGFSEDTQSHDEDGRNGYAAVSAAFSEWVMSQNEEQRADIAYEVLRTLRTANIAAVVERLTPLLHMDPLEKLPPEITAEIFAYLDAATLLTASLASRTWRRRTADSRLWQKLYASQGWGVDKKEVKTMEAAHTELVRQDFRKTRGQLRGSEQSGQRSLKKRATSDWLESHDRRASADVSQWREQHGAIEADTDSAIDGADQIMHDAPSTHGSPQRPNKRQSQDSGDDMDMYESNGTTMGQIDSMKPSGHDDAVKPKLLRKDSSGGERLNWAYLYKQRQRLEENWNQGRYTNFQLPHPDHPEEAHTECVYTIQFFGKWLVSGSRDKTLRIWDMDTRRLKMKPLSGHSQSVLCLQFDPTDEEDVIISGSSDSSIIVWRFSTGQKLHEIPSAHEESVLNLRFDHRYLVTCSKDKKIKIWNRKALTATDAEYPRIKSGTGARYPSYIVNVAAMEPSLLEARLANGTIKELKQYSLLMTLEGHGAAVNAIQINGDVIVSASGDRLIKMWNVKDGSNIRTLNGHMKGIACVQYDSRRIVSGSSDNTVRIYDPLTGGEVAVLSGHTNLVRTVQAGFGDLPGSDEENRLAARAAEQEYVNDVDSGAIVEDRHHQRRVTHGQLGTSRLAIGSTLPPGGGGSRWGRIVSGSYDESIIIWKKDSLGHWCKGQILRQEAIRGTPDTNQAAQVPPPAPTPANLAAPTQPPPPHPCQTIDRSTSMNATNTSNPTNLPVLSASQIIQSTVGAMSVSGIHSAISNTLGNIRTSTSGTAQWSLQSPNGTLSRNPLLTAGVSQAVAQFSAQAQDAVQRAVQQSIQAHNDQIQNGEGIINGTYHQQTTQNGGLAPASTIQPGVQANSIINANNNAPAAAAAAAAGAAAAGTPQSVSRVFKLQFDARRIVCCSQDSRIIGWDFANGDQDIVESSRFFVGP